MYYIFIVPMSKEDIFTEELYTKALKVNKALEHAVLHELDKGSK